ncbi:MAG: DNA polymerase III subunit delta [Planctomycetes bacterium]|nr:DNA polymerase III subunit delta [Planctomycetota bacterium]
MPRASALQLDRELDKLPVQPVYTLVGENDALLTRSQALLVERLAPPDQTGSTVKYLEKVEQPYKVFDELRTMPFMGMEGRRIVVVGDGDGFLKDHGESLARYLENPSPTGVLILRMNAPRKGKKLPAVIRSAGLLVDCGKVKWRDAQGWIRARAREMGKRITPDAAYGMVEALGPNLLALENELQKLAAFADPEDMIDRRHLDAVGTGGRTRSAYDLGNAISRGDRAEALRLAGRLLLEGEELPAIIAILAGQVRRLWRIKRLHSDGASQKQIVAETGARPFAVRDALKVIGRLSDEWFAHQLKILSDADYESKSASLPAAQKDVWLESLVARMCAG